MLTRLLLSFFVLTASCGQGQQPQLPTHAVAVSNAALRLTKTQVRYDPTYFRIPYPNGDVPADRGVCTDVVIRTYRQLGVDLQRAVHEDMKAHFAKYPRKWGLQRTDTNIDHRRVPNLMTFFTRHGQSLTVTKQGRDYVPGDIVTWTLPGNLTHIGIVVDKHSADQTRYLIVHNIGRGQEVSDCLFSWPVTGHYRYGGN